MTVSALCTFLGKQEEEISPGSNRQLGERGGGHNSLMADFPSRALSTHVNHYTRYSYTLAEGWWGGGLRGIKRVFFNLV